MRRGSCGGGEGMLLTVMDEALAGKMAAVTLDDGTTCACPRSVTFFSPTTSPASRPAPAAAATRQRAGAPAVASALAPGRGRSSRPRSWRSLRDFWGSGEGGRADYLRGPRALLRVEVLGVPSEGAAVPRGGESLAAAECAGGGSSSSTGAAAARGAVARAPRSAEAEAKAEPWRLRAPPAARGSPGWGVAAGAILPPPPHLARLAPRAVRACLAEAGPGARTEMCGPGGPRAATGCGGHRTGPRRRRRRGRDAPHGAGTRIGGAGQREHRRAASESDRVGGHARAVCAVADAVYTRLRLGLPHPAWRQKINLFRGARALVSCFVLTPPLNGCVIASLAGSRGGSAPVVVTMRVSPGPAQVCGRRAIRDCRINE
jgi:hypothetical protein